MNDDCPFAVVPGVAHRNNTVTQRYIAEEGGIPVLVHILMNPPSQEVQVEVAISLGSVVLSNRANQEKLQEEDSFKFDILLNLLTSDEQVLFVCYRAPWHVGNSGDGGVGSYVCLVHYLSHLP